MGQYYKYLIERENEEFHTAESWDYDYGGKLLEHSYIGNPYVNSCLTNIFKKPANVAWIGDYSKDGAHVYNDKAEDFNKYYSLIWGDEEETISSDRVLSEDELVLFNRANTKYYLVNHTKGYYIDLEKYYELNAFKYDESEDYYWCLNPLPLLTACGNGQGGGDYSRPNPDLSEVGSWALDCIEFTDERPNQYEEVMYEFREV